MISGRVQLFPGKDQDSCGHHWPRRIGRIALVGGPDSEELPRQSPAQVQGRGAHAIDLGNVATVSGLARPTVYRDLTGDGNASLATVAPTLGVTALRFTVEPARRGLRASNRTGFGAF